jgi:hypothetical protein
LSQFGAGLKVTGDLFGSEHIYWAKGHKHDSYQNGRKIKQLVPGDARREAANILI